MQAPQPEAKGLRHIRQQVATLGTRIRVWLLLTPSRRAVRLARLSLALVDAEIRLAKQGALQLGEDLELDDVVEHVARLVTHRDAVPSLHNSVVAQSELAQELSRIATGSQRVKDAAAAFHLARSFVATRANRDIEAAEYMKYAAALQPNAQPLDDKAVSQSLATTARRLREARGTLAERSAAKVHLSLPEVTSAAGLASVAFVAAGYLYTRYFFGAFDVDATLFFSVGDYLATSIEQLRYAAFAVGFALLPFVVGIRTASLRPRAVSRALEPSRRRGGYAIAAIAVAFWAISVWSVYTGHPQFDAMRASGLIAAYFAADKLTDWFFTNKLTAMVTVSSLLIFASSVGMSAYEKSFRLKGGTYETAPVRVFLKDDGGSTPVDGQLIAANSGYVFVLGGDRRTVTVIPRERVHRFVSTTRQ